MNIDHAFIVDSLFMDSVVSSLLIAKTFTKWNDRIQNVFLFCVMKILELILLLDRQRSPKYTKGCVFSCLDAFWDSCESLIFKNSSTSTSKLFYKEQFLLK